MMLAEDQCKFLQKCFFRDSVKSEVGRHGGNVQGVSVVGGVRDYPTSLGLNSQVHLTEHIVLFILRFAFLRNNFSIERVFV